MLQCILMATYGVGVDVGPGDGVSSGVAVAVAVGVGVGFNGGLSTSPRRSSPVEAAMR